MNRKTKRTKKKTTVITELLIPITQSPLQRCYYYLWPVALLLHPLKRMPGCCYYSFHLSCQNIRFPPSSFCNGNNEKRFLGAGGPSVRVVPIKPKLWRREKEKLYNELVTAMVTTFLRTAVPMCSQRQV